MNDQPDHKTERGLIVGSGEGSSITTNTTSAILEELFLNAEKRNEISQEIIETTAERVMAANQERFGRDRSYIAIAIIGTYGFAIFPTILYILFTVPSCSGIDIFACIMLNETWDLQSERLLELVVTTVLPIVTLMLGFYFGTETVRNASKA